MGSTGHGKGITQPGGTGSKTLLKSHSESRDEGKCRVTLSMGESRASRGKEATERRLGGP